MTVAEVCAGYWKHAQMIYRKPDGTVTTSVDNFRQALRPLNALYANTPAVEFGTKH